MPRFEIRHTSEEHEGQIYMPRINAGLLVGVLLLVALFRSSSALAPAYGIAVTGTMVVTAIMAFIVVHEVWGSSLPATIALIAPVIAVDSTFFRKRMHGMLRGDQCKWLLADDEFPDKTFRQLCSFTRSRPDSGDGRFGEAAAPCMCMKP